MSVSEIKRQTAKFITFEGGDGAGKSTQIGRLSFLLTHHQIPHIVTREPGGTPQGEKIRHLLVEGDPEEWDGVSEAFLMAAARREHIRRRIWPALETGKWVLCDRFSDSTFAYQGYGRGLGEEFISQLNTLTMGDFQPDLTFVFQLNAQVGVARKKADGTQENRFELCAENFHTRLAEGYEALLSQNPERCMEVQANDSLESITQKIWNILKEKEFV